MTGFCHIDIIEDLPDIRGFEYDKAVLILNEHGIVNIDWELTAPPGTVLSKPKLCDIPYECRVIKQKKTGEDSASLLLCLGIRYEID